MAGALARGAATKPAATTPAATRPATTQPGAKVTEEGWFAPIVRQSKLPPLPEKVTSAFVIPVREPITTKTYEAISRKLVRCQASGAQLIVLDMDTWGGEAEAAHNIARQLKTEARDTRVVCYVRTRAISAGSMIAMACDEIVMTPVGIIGDCAPIIPGQILKGIEREKIETVLRTEFAESANLHGYSPAMSVSMVSADLEVWLIRQKKTRELRYVLADDFRGRVTIPPGLSKGKTNQKANWDLLRLVVPADKPLTMDSGKAVEYGFASAIVEAPQKDPLSALAKHYNVTGGFEVLAGVLSGVDWRICDKRLRATSVCPSGRKRFPPDRPPA